MGHNSLIFLCNDAISEIEKDPAGWWRRTWQALSDPRDRDSSYGFGNHANGFQAVWNQHADVCGLIFVGGNRAEVLAKYSPGGKGQPGDLLVLLDKAAREIGFKLVPVLDDEPSEPAREDLSDMPGGPDLWAGMYEVPPEDLAAVMASEYEDEP